MSGKTIILTTNQINILKKLSEAGEGLIGREFADIATRTHGKWEWAGPILNALADKGYVEKTDALRQGVRIWVITQDGRDALAIAQPRALADAKDAPLSPAQMRRFELVAKAHPWPEENCTGHATNDALERRGLVTQSAKDRGWVELRLTEKGLEGANRLFGMQKVMPENIDEFSFDS